MSARQVCIEVHDIALHGLLRRPQSATGLVLFAHGSGSGHRSPRNNFVAERLAAAGIATLLIVGGEDHPVLALNRQARGQLTCPSELAVVPAATHLFEEPGALEQVAALAAGWFARHLGSTRTAHRASSPLPR